MRVVSGLIPAHAGNTYSPWRSGPSRSAHPRSREEHGSTRQMCGIWPDSSPLTQGTLGTNAQLVAQNRLIPARAGSTAAKALRTTTSAAHPRSRWEHSSVSIVCSTTHGSSPLARGTPSRYLPRLLEPGLIPARAGSTRHQAHQKSQPTAHPRSRGEHSTRKRL